MTNTRAPSPDGTRPSYDDDALHAVCIAALPWYLNGTLDDSEDALTSSEVETHLARCTVCERELASLQQLAEVVRLQADSFAWQSADAAAACDAIIARDRHASLGSNAASERLRAIAGYCGRWLVAPLAVPAWALAAPAALLLLVGATALLREPAQVGPQFRTFSEAPAAQVPAMQAGLLLVVDPATTARELQALLRSVDARIVDGPSSVGAYRLSLADTDRLEHARDTLRAHPLVRLVERVERVDPTPVGTRQ